MDNIVVFAIQLIFAYILFGLLAKWYLVPWLRARPLESALVWLIAPHSLRIIGLSFLSSAVVAADLPLGFAGPAAWGDLLAAVLAVVVVYALRKNYQHARILVWVFVVVSLLDFAYAHVGGAIFSITDYHLGTTWYFPTLIVPMLVISNILTIWMMSKNESRTEA